MVGNKDVLVIVNILRRVTTLVKLYPFAYTILYICCMLVYMFGSESLAILCDQMFYTSPFIILCAIGLSYSLKLCKWHRLQCSLPLLPLVPLAIDYMWSISKFGAIINVATIIILLISSLINAYFVFIKPKR